MLWNFKTEMEMNKLGINRRKYLKVIFFQQVEVGYNSVELIETKIDT